MIENATYAVLAKLDPKVDAKGATSTGRTLGVGLRPLPERTPSWPIISPMERMIG